MEVWLQRRNRVADAHRQEASLPARDLACAPGRKPGTDRRGTFTTALHSFPAWPSVSESPEVSLPAQGFRARALCQHRYHSWLHGWTAG